MKNNWWVIILLLLSACDSEQEETTTTPNTKPVALEVISLKEIPAFDEEQAYQFIQDQVDFGPRIPNTETHIKCATYLAKTLADLGLDTIVQRTDVTAFNGNLFLFKTLLASITLML